MTDSLAAPERTEEPSPSRGRLILSRSIRGLGWTLIAAGIVVLLYLAYLLWFTNLRTGLAQRDLLDAWQLEFGDPNAALPGELGVETEVVDPAGPGDAYAVMWFTDGVTGERKVTSEPLYVVEGVEVPDLRRGPGHYPTTAGPGEAGNFSISGHRTTYGAPFYNLDQLAEGDVINVIDRNNVRWHYRVRDGSPGVDAAHRIVAPTDVWVIGNDPLGWGEPMMTLTTCHPRFSSRQRMVVFAELDPDYVPPEVEDANLPVTDAIEAPTLDPEGTDARPWAVPDVLLIAIAIGSLALTRINRRQSTGARAGRGLLYLVSFLAVTAVLFASVFPRVESVLEDPVLEAGMDASDTA
ncbi:MAG: sortase [Nitriliruptorales bacterium]|nr:sortase [Nitriliruptorales bacterium]